MEIGKPWPMPEVQDGKGFPEQPRSRRTGPKKAPSPETAGQVGYLKMPGDEV